jgi:hypothetical protein
MMTKKAVRLEVNYLSAQRMDYGIGGGKKTAKVVQDMRPDGSW